ncbi:TPA: outer membrane protein [Legionella feeleii]
MKYTGLCITVLSLSISATFAATINSPGPINQTGFFAGLGGSYNFFRINSEMSGSLNATSGFVPIGLFSGATGSYSKTKEVFAPEGQLGYFQPISGGQWLWGIEFLYQYSRAKIISYNQFQEPGTSINFINPSVNVTDEISISSIQTRVNDKLMLPLFIGRSLTNSFIYLGAGPAVFRTKHTVDVSADTVSGLYAGNLNGFSNTKWVWGGAVQAGIAFYLNPTWFLKFNYSYAITDHYKANNLLSFSPEVNGGLNGGTVSFSTSQRLIAQEVAVSINKVFSL